MYGNTGTVKVYYYGCAGVTDTGTNQVYCRFSSGQRYCHAYGYGVPVYVVSVVGDGNNTPDFANVGVTG